MFPVNMSAQKEACELSEISIQSKLSIAERWREEAEVYLMKVDLARQHATIFRIDGSPLLASREGFCRCSFWLCGSVSIIDKMMTP